MKPTFFRLILVVMAMGLITGACKKKEPCNPKTTFELLTMDDWHLYKETVKSNSGSSDLNLDSRWVFTINKHYYYYNSNDDDYAETGTFELDEDSDPDQLHFTKQNGTQLSYDLLEISENAMKWEYHSGIYTYIFYFER